ncbi:hypothetical protein ACH5RR_026749 [Cinchona calisaya]|uniref:Uncharacterized protein n=1 Tax=Cinchona calisaya TaxID=153742 RepID=A0ABD2Z3H0_9GENT
MFARISGKLFINGGSCGGSGSSFFFKSLLDHYYSTSAAAAARPQKNTRFLEEYLIKSLGFSKIEAISTSSKFIRSNPIKKDPNLVVNFLLNLGLTKSHIKNVVYKSPQLLFSDVDKTLLPKITYLQGLGLSGLDLAKLLVKYHRILVRGLDNHLVPRIEYLRKLLGTDDKVVLALKKFALVPGNRALEKMERNVLLLRDNGFCSDDIAKFVIKNPIKFFIRDSEMLQDVLRRVEYEWGIPRDATMFSYAVDVLSSSSKSKIDAKFEILRSYGWSDVEILRIVRILPPVLNLSEARMRRVLDYFMKEVGCTPDYLASRPVLFTLSLEGRVKPRNEVLKILNEKKLNMRNASLCKVLYLRESQFQDAYLLPYKDVLPDMYESYLKKVGGQKINKL